MYSVLQHFAYSRLSTFIQSILIFCEYERVKFPVLIHFYAYIQNIFNIINLTLFPINSSFHLLAASALDLTRGVFTELTHVILMVSDAIP